MSNAFKCDRCDVLFEANRCDCLLVTTREGDDYDTKAEVDLCPACYGLFSDFANGKGRERPGVGTERG